MKTLLLESFKSSVDIWHLIAPQVGFGRDDFLRLLPLLCSCDCDVRMTGEILTQAQITQVNCALKTQPSA